MRGVIIIKRLTSLRDKKYYVDDANVQHGENGYSGDAVDKLAKFENVYDNLIANQDEISKELERLRLEGKTRTVKFKQLLANKMTNHNIIVLFETYGL